MQLFGSCLGLAVLKKNLSLLEGLEFTPAASATTKGDMLRIRTWYVYKSRSEDRATGHDNEVVLGYQKTSEEAIGASESAVAAAAPTMVPGAPSREENRLERVGGTSPHARENAPEGAQEQELLHGKQQQQPPRAGDAFRSKKNVTLVPAPEQLPPDAENIEEDSRIPSRRRGVRSRGRLRGGERREQGEVEEEPTWLDGGWCGGCSGGSGPSQLGRRTKRSRAGNWTLDGRQQVLA